ncbi:MAG: DUF255 domain-containing protein [Planctomycetes bacterium]|nr:DUF255 domain-containing protein [Planctomycetota bacterium]
MSSIEWLEWNDEAFEKAETQDRPVLLTIYAAWCRWCKSMDDEAFADKEVARIVQENFIPIRVDKDKRPDIDDRYNMGGWPSTAFLTHEGDLITGGTYFSAKELALLLTRISSAYKEDRTRIEESIREEIQKEEAKNNKQPVRGGQLNLKIITNVSRSIYREYDEKYGGFGTGQKFPHSEALDFAMVQYFKTNDLKLFGVINKTLKGMAEGQLFDQVGGGFFRYCTTRDWRTPHTEKLLETNVKLLHNYLDAARVMKRDSYRKVAEKTCSYICSELWDKGKKAFYGSQDADDDFYEMEALDRKDRKPPQVDRTIYANLNAMTAGAFFKAGAVLDEPKLQEMAISAIEFVLKHMYTPERGVYHYFDTSRHILGLLADQIYLCDALLHAVEYRGENRYLEVIRDLIDTIVKKQSSDMGGFYDISVDRAAHGGLRRQNKSILENAAMAGVLIRYYYLTFEKSYLNLAERTLKAFSHDYHLYGYFTAGYARAVDLFFYNPIYVIIMGEQHSPKTELLRKSATRLYLPSCIALTIDPKREPDLVERMQFPIGKEPKAYVCLEQACHAAVDDPEGLYNAILELEASRAPLI